MIIIHLNNQALKIEKETTLKNILIEHGYNNGGFAILVNQNFIPYSQYNGVRVKADDQIEIIFPMQGG